jgi:hypothetical protein
LRGHHLTFGIARHQADAIRAGCEFELGAHWNSSVLAIEHDVVHKTKGLSGKYHALRQYSRQLLDEAETILRRTKGAAIGR